MIPIVHFILRSTSQTHIMSSPNLPKPSPQFVKFHPIPVSALLYPSSPPHNNPTDETHYHRGILVGDVSFIPSCGRRIKCEGHNIPNPYLFPQSSHYDLYAPKGKPPGTSPVHQDKIDLKNFPKFENTKPLKGTMYKGDILFIPHSYWHQVVSFAPSNRNMAVNAWFGMLQDHRWWQSDVTDMNLDNDRKTIKEMGVCTPIAEGATFGDIQFFDEGVFKNLLTVLQRREKVRARKKQEDGEKREKGAGKDQGGGKPEKKTVAHVDL